MAGDDGIGRLRWRCRRGMKELDLVLGRWLDTHYAGADAARRADFERLLETPDPQLADWLFRRERPADAGTARLVDELLVGPR